MREWTNGFDDAGSKSGHDAFYFLILVRADGQGDARVNGREEGVAFVEAFLELAHHGAGVIEDPCYLAGLDAGGRVNQYHGTDGRNRESPPSGAGGSAGSRLGLDHGRTTT